MSCRQHALEMFTIIVNVISVFKARKSLASFLNMSIEMQSMLAFYVAFETHLDIVYLL